MKAFIILIISTLFCLSCKKDELSEDKEIFVAEWKWKHSQHKKGMCGASWPHATIISPDTENTNYSITFFVEGIVKFYRNDTLISEDEIRFAEFGEGSCLFIDDCKSFHYNMKNESKDDNYLMYGAINTDTIVFTQGFPFPAYEYQKVSDGCDRYISYFVKE